MSWEPGGSSLFTVCHSIFTFVHRWGGPGGGADACKRCFVVPGRLGRGLVGLYDLLTVVPPRGGAHSLVLLFPLPIYSVRPPTKHAASHHCQRSVRGLTHARSCPHAIRLELHRPARRGRGVGDAHMRPFVRSDSPARCRDPPRAPSGPGGPGAHGAQRRGANTVGPRPPHARTSSRRGRVSAHRMASPLAAVAGRGWGGLGAHPRLAGPGLLAQTC